MERYLFPLRILITLLILTMLLPGWGLLNASNASEETPAITTPVIPAEAIGSVSPFER